MGIIERLKQHARSIKTEAYALVYATKDHRTPWYAKLLVTGIVAYALSPIDLIPDFIPVIGYLDDLILLPIAIIFAIKLIPDQVMLEARQKALQGVSIKQSTRWLTTAIIITIWLVTAALLWQWLMTLKR